MPTAPSDPATRGFPNSAAEWPLLRNALSSPIQELIAVEVPGPEYAQSLIEAVVSVAPRRQLRVLSFDALAGTAAALVEQARTQTVHAHGDSTLSFLIDRTVLPVLPDEAAKTRLATFWRAINQHREHWARLPGQTVFVLSGTGYAALNEHALHLKRWMALKLHLLPPPRPVTLDSPFSSTDQRERSQESEALGTVDQVGRLERQLARAEQAGETGPGLTARYLQPLLDASVTAGRLKQVRELLSKIWREGWPAEAEFSVLKSAAQGYWRLGDYPRLADVEKRLLAIIQPLADSDPANSAWQRDLSVSFNQLGDLATAQGNLPDASRHFSSALAIAQRLADSDPANSAWQRDLSISFNKLGDLATAQGNLPDASRHFSSALAIAQRLADSDRDNSAWQRDLFYSFYKLSSLEEQRRDLPAALSYAEKCLAVTERLAALSPKNATWQNDARFSRALVARLRAS